MALQQKNHWQIRILKDKVQTPVSVPVEMYRHSTICQHYFIYLYHYTINASSLRGQQLSVNHFLIWWTCLVVNLLLSIVSMKLTHKFIKDALIHVLYSFLLQTCVGISSTTLKIGNISPLSKRFELVYEQRTYLCIIYPFVHPPLPSYLNNMARTWSLRVLVLVCLLRNGNAEPKKGYPRDSDAIYKHDVTMRSISCRHQCSTALEHRRSL